MFRLNNRLINRMKPMMLIACMGFILASCSKGPADPFKGMRGKGEAQLYTMGEKALSDGRYSQATKDFEALQGIYPFGTHSEQAQLEIIYAYYRADNTDMAMIAADRYIKLYPNARHVDYAYYMRGFIGFSAGRSWISNIVPSAVDPAARDVSRLRSSFASFSMLVERFPHSTYVPESRRYMVLIRNMMARHELLVASYYFKREAYLAAANRAVVVVQHYQGTQSVPKALSILVQSYYRLNLDQMAHSTYAIFKANYANTSEFRELNEQLAHDRGQASHSNPRSS